MRVDLSEQSERMQSFFNLKHDPFGTVVDAMVFSGAGGRYETAETIRHLLTYSQQDSVLSGSIGSGKRTLAQQVLKMLEDHWRVAWVDASDIETVSDLEKEIIGQLGLGLRLDDENLEMDSLITQAVESRLENEAFLIVIQFAERLPQHAFEWLVSLRQQASDIDNRIRQLWLADADAFDSSLLLDEEWSFHSLAALSDADAEQYLKDRLIASGYVGDLPLSKKDVSRINQISNGFPDALNSAARDFLIGSTFKTTERSQPFPITHVIAGLAALCLVIVAFLYQRGENQADTQLVELDKPLEEMTAVEQRLADAVAKVEAKQQESEENTVEGDSTPVVTEISSTSDSSAAIEETVPPVESETSTVEILDVEAEAPAPSQLAETLSTPVIETLMARGQDTQFTMQLIGVRDRSKLIELVSEFRQPELVDIIETTYEGKPWYVLVYGQFDTRDAAQAAVATLPESLKDTQPWIRTFSSLRNPQ